MTATLTAPAVSKAVLAYRRQAADTIRTYVAGRGWSQAEAALQLGASQSAISNVKTGAIEKVSTDALMDMLAAIRLSTPLPPAWADEAVRHRAIAPDRFAATAQPLPTVEPLRTHPGISATEMARIVGGRYGWVAFEGALYTTDGVLIASSLELAAAAMQSLELIDPSTGQFGFWVHAEHEGITEAVRAEAGRLMGRV